MESATVAQKGIPHAENIKASSTRATKYSRKEAPITRLIRKNEAPVLREKKSETRFQISVDGGEVQPVIQRKQNISNDKIPQNVSYDYLDVAQLTVNVIHVANCARNADKSYAA
jgi:hypothetical protein